MLTEKFDSTNYEKDKYLILNRYLEYYETEKRNENKKKKEDNDYFSLDNLNTFISVLNLFNDNYSHLISRDFAESKIFEDDEL